MLIENDIISSAASFLKGRDLKKYFIHIALSVLLGAASGAGAVLFHILLAQGKTLSLVLTKTFSMYAVILLPVIGSIFIVLMVKFFPKLAGEKGVLSVIKAIIRNNGYISFKTTVYNFTGALVSIGTGAPLGPEAPSAQIGCGIGSFLSRKMKLTASDVRMYTAAAGGAAVAAVFNAPIAGVFFGVEVLLLNDMKNNALSSLVIACVTSDLVSRNLMGNERVFSFPPFAQAQLSDYPYLVLLGIMCGFYALVYSRLSAGLGSLLSRFPRRIIILPLVALIFGFVLVRMPHLYGVGYETISLTANAGFSLWTLILIFALKSLFVMAFLAAGGYGGTFAPSLILGAVGGYIFSLVCSSYFGLSPNHALFCIAGMAGMLAGMNSVPLTAIMLVFEMTNDYSLVLPLMICSMISYLFTLIRNRYSIYTLALLESGIDVTRKGETDVLGSVEVRNLRILPPMTVRRNTRFDTLIKAVLTAEEGTVFVTDDANRLCGIISLSGIRQTLSGGGMETLFIASDLMTPYAAVTPASSISEAAEAAERCQTPLIPVVDSLSSLVIIGAISQHAIITAYNDQVERNDSDEFLIRYSSNKNRPQ